jgi:hypothetical protein
MHGVFHNMHALPLVILDKVKRKARLWVCVEDKRIEEIMIGCNFMLFFCSDNLVEKSST